MLSSAYPSSFQFAGKNRWNSRGTAGMRLGGFLEDQKPFKFLRLDNAAEWMC